MASTNTLRLQQQSITKQAPCSAPLHVIYLLSGQTRYGAAKPFDTSIYRRLIDIFGPDTGISSSNQRAVMVLVSV